MAVRAKYFIRFTKILQFLNNHKDPDSLLNATQYSCWPGTKPSYVSEEISKYEEWMYECLRNVPKPVIFYLINLVLYSLAQSKLILIWELGHGLFNKVTEIQT